MVLYIVDDERKKTKNAPALWNPYKAFLGPPFDKVVMWGDFFGALDIIKDQREQQVYDLSYIFLVWHGLVVET